MNKLIFVDPNLPADLRDTVEHRMKIELRSLSGQIEMLRISLIDRASVTECSVRASGKSGRTLKFSIFNSESGIAIADALARLRREMLRDRTYNQAM